MTFSKEALGYTVLGWFACGIIYAACASLGATFPWVATVVLGLMVGVAAAEIDRLRKKLDQNGIDHS